ncbi:MAG TPA: 6-carboxytetrahydropterin synthase [Polyangiaceae bacterium LLY-WYZ-14_1]|nr:6-carboxytetrahydropterin synthase [Polyangiaceae bacterium LLY-WYZ-14_1]
MGDGGAGTAERDGRRVDASRRVDAEERARGLEGRTTTIELFKERMKFSAGHFTIFDERHRERLHGHNFGVFCALTGLVDDNGMLADYGEYKRDLQAVCDSLDEYFLLPGDSPHLTIRDAGPDRIEALFADDVIPFLRKDVRVLPVRNVTLEELSRYLVQELVKDDGRLTRDRLIEVVVKVSSGPGQTASHRWRSPSAILA